MGRVLKMLTPPKSVASLLKVLLISCLAAPVMYVSDFFLKFCFKYNIPLTIITLIGFGVLSGIFFLYYTLLLGTKKDIQDPFFYVFAVFSFTSVVDLFVGLEYDGFVTGFMGEYLASGEPYLATPYGAMLCYWDIAGMYPMYLIMCARIASRKNYRELALFWAANISNSVFVILIAVLYGKSGVHPGTILNLPYLVLPMIVGWSFLQQRYKPKVINKSKPKPLGERQGDRLFVAYLVFATIITVIRAMTVLDSPVWIAQAYGKYIEPHLFVHESMPFMKTQMLIYFFYFIPMFVLSIHALIRPGCTWMVDLSLIHAGGSVQGQIAHIGASVHFRTPEALQVPANVLAQFLFWSFNLALLIVPLLLLWRCIKFPNFFFETSVKIKNDKKK